LEKINNNYRVSACPFCNSDEIVNKGKLYYFSEVEYSTHKINLTHVPEIWKCKKCRSFFTQNAIIPADAERLYATGEGTKRWSPKSFTEDKTIEVRKCLDNYLKGKNAKLLDIGCNTGEFLDYAKTFGINTFGLELCEQSCNIVKKKGHGIFRTGAEINGKFDIITAFDVFEHIYDPNGFMSFMKSMLSNNGIIIIVTGNPDSFPARLSKNKWWYFNYPEHVIFPSPSYFDNLRDFKIIDRMNAFASILHDEKGFFFAIKNLLKIILYRNYSGRPAIVPDHQLIILQKAVNE
jgi:2-polyprenyl-3-methyl-5-hydroxy-6-metoxy-1,4-benzoquinol methylase